jgi:hypothetical protein
MNPSVNSCSSLSNPEITWFSSFKGVNDPVALKLMIVSQMCGFCCQNFLGERALCGLTTHLGHYWFF